MSPYIVFILIVSVFINPISFAAKVESSSVQVLVIDPLINPKNFETDTIHPRRVQKLKQVSVTHRDHLFEKVGLTSYLKDFNELQKNKLYLSASSAPVDRLTQQYPLLPKDRLTALRVAILKNGRIN